VHALVLVLNVAAREILLQRESTHHVFGVAGSHLHLNVELALVGERLLNNELLFA